jgi:tetratricopeptide (TPR) repeat protein
MPKLSPLSRTGFEHNGMAAHRHTGEAGPGWMRVMATDTDRAGSPPGGGSNGPPLRRLWQVPTFVIGLLAVAGVHLARPLWHESETRRIERDLAGVEQRLDDPNAAPDAIVTRAEGLLGRTEPFPDYAGQAHFLLGSAYLRQAAQAPAGPAADASLKARSHLEQADTKGVPEPQRARLRYRLAKTWFQTGANPLSIIHYLAPSIEQGAEDRVEGYGLLAQAYLRLPASEATLRAALDANQKQIAQPTADDAVLAPARLLRGELLLRLHEPGEARKVLSFIGPNAPPDVRARARSVRAGCLQEEQQWQEAVPAWKEILADPAEAAREQGRIWYNLGVCHRGLGQNGEAADAWKNALNHGGEEAQAAAVRLAELALPGGSAADVVDMLGRALGEVGKPEDYRNPLVSLAEVRALLEKGCRDFRSARDYARARRLALLAEKVMLPGPARALLGDVSAAWAAALREQGDDKAGAYFREAGSAYEAVAHAGDPPAPWLWRSAECYLQAPDFAAAIAALERLVGLPEPATRLGEAWYRLAETQSELRGDEAANAAYRKCIEYPGPFAFRARYRLAMADLDVGRLEQAEEAFRQNLQLLDETPEPDREAREQTVVALADLLYRRGKYSPALLTLQQALKHYPNNPAALTMRYHVGECWMRLAFEAFENLRDARNDEARARYQTEYARGLREALAQFEGLKEELVTRKNAGPPAEAEDRILRTLGFLIAGCRFDLGRYLDARTCYQELAQQHRGRVESLIALQGVWQCSCQMDSADRIQLTLDQIDNALRALPDAAFEGRPETKSRQWWQGWLEDRRLEFERVRRRANPNAPP